MKQVTSKHTKPVPDPRGRRGEEVWDFQRGPGMKEPGSSWMSVGLGCAQPVTSSSRDLCLNALRSE